MKTLSDFNTLAEAQSYISYVIEDADDIRAHLMLKGKWGKIIQHTLTATDPMFDAASGLVHKVQFKDPISFNSETEVGQAHLMMLEAFEALGYLTEEEKQEIISLSHVKPYESTTQAQFNSIKGIYTAKSIDYTGGANLIITLPTSLPEKVSVTLWHNDDGFEKENAGRTVHVQNANKYRLSMSGKQAGKYEVRIPLENIDFTVEVL